MGEQGAALPINILVQKGMFVNEIIPFLQASFPVEHRLIFDCTT